MTKLRETVKIRTVLPAETNYLNAYEYKTPTNYLNMVMSRRYSIKGKVKEEGYLFIDNCDFDVTLEKT